MVNWRMHLKNMGITLSIMVLSFIGCILLQDIIIVKEQITAVFVFAVFLVSLLTDGYIFGIVATVLGVLAVNYAFTFPYFAFSFTLREDFLSTAVMLVVSLMTGTLTTRIKRGEALKAEGERERMRANLLRAVSHDLRTPLTTIYGASSTVIENYEGLSDAQKRRLIEGIREDAEWLMRIFENLLSVTKLEDGTLKLIKTPTVLDELIDSVFVKFKKRYPEQKIELSIPDEVVLIPMDAILIEQVLINLLENAVQHATGMTKLSLCVYIEGAQAHFEVTDNGVGIDKKRLGLLFTGYSGAEEESPDKKKRNAGIGLSVCASIVKAHGGEIRAQNCPEGGARFGFVLNLGENSDEQQV